MKEVTLLDQDGQPCAVTLIDDEDYHRITTDYRYAGYSWKLSGGYAFVRSTAIHRLVMHSQWRRGIEIDHINRNKLDNRKENLRFATRAQNAMNMSKPIMMRGDITSSALYKGVAWDGYHAKLGKKPWGAYIKVNQVKRRLGRYWTEEEAARAYDAAATECFGEYACLNFP